MGRKESRKKAVSRWFVPLVFGCGVFISSSFFNLSLNVFGTLDKVLGESKYYITCFANGGRLNRNPNIPGRCIAKAHDANKECRSSSECESKQCLADICHTRDAHYGSCVSSSGSCYEWVGAHVTDCDNGKKVSIERRTNPLTCIILD